MTITPERVAELRALIASDPGWDDIALAVMPHVDALLDAADENARLHKRIAELEHMVEAGPVPPACSVDDWADAHMENARLRAERDESLAVIREVVESIPSTYDNDDPMVRRHARSLNAANSFVARIHAKENKNHGN